VTFALLIGLSFTYSPGTGDVEVWEAWINNAAERGLVAGYAANYDTYPPLATAILWAAEQVFQPLGAGTLLNVKFSILFFLILSRLGLLALDTRSKSHAHPLFCSVAQQRGACLCRYLLCSRPHFFVVDA
jgi:hypothetical protein